MSDTKFYEFRQNNTGGSFEILDKEGICEYVIIEANNAKEANKKAESIGIYFDGCDKDMDCPCCGDRWYTVDESDGSSVPSIYGEPVEKMESTGFRNSCFVHYLDGTFKKIEFKD